MNISETETRLYPKVLLTLFKPRIYLYFEEYFCPARSLMSTEIPILEPNHFLVVAAVNVWNFRVHVLVVDHFHTVLSVQSQLVVYQLLEEAVVGFDERPFAFDVIERVEQRHLLVFHQVREAQARGSAHSGYAMHQRFSP